VKLEFDRRSSQISDREKTVDEILAQAMEVLSQKGKAKTYSEPVRTRLYYEFLSPAVANPVAVTNLYLTDGVSYPPTDTKNFLGEFVVVHGHPVGKGCFAPTFCHVLGYKPTGEEHPKFIENFYKKWPMLNEKRNIDTGTSSSQRLF